MADTLRLWKDLKAGKYDVYISDVTTDEIARCNEEKFNILTKYMREIKYSVIAENDEILDVAEKIIEMGILRPKSHDDCVHIATAVIGGCDYVVSWNFKHMVNVKTIDGVRAITNLGNYRNIEIVAPSMLLESED